MFKKKIIETKETNYEQCIKLLSQYNIPSDLKDELKSQIKAIVEELETIGQNIDITDIVEEVIEQNDLTKTVKKGKAEAVKISYSVKNFYFTNETLNKLDINCNYSGVTIDLRDFEFSAGELEISVSGKCSSVDIYINRDVKVNDWTNLKASGISYSLENDGYNVESFHNLPRETYNNEIRLEGDLILGGIQVRVGYEGEILHHHQGKRTSNRISRAEKRLEKRYAKTKLQMEKLENKKRDNS